MTWPDLIKLLVLDNMDELRFWALLAAVFIVATLWAARPVLVALIQRPMPAQCATPVQLVPANPPTAQPPPAK